MNTGQDKLGEAATVGDLVLAVAAELEAAGLFYGHGTDNPHDEAAALVFHVLDLSHDREDAYDQPVSSGQQAQVKAMLAQRIESRKPLAYLLGEAWFCGRPYFVDERVLVPRSPIAELIADRFQPWVAPDSVRRILEIGTGSGCIAIACALAFPEAEVVATDISPEALEVAARNVSRQQVESRLELVRTDHADGISGQFDLLVSNPPYVPSGEARELPVEYGHEPSLGLYSGSDGLDSARRILQDASRLLSPQGVLVLEVGAQWQALEQAFPQLPVIWLEFANGGEGVGIIEAAALH